MSKLLDPQTLANVHGLRLRARHIVEGLIAGSHRSPHRGFSIEFAEHRDYAPGDDLRYLDWKVLGRTDKYYVKQFEDEMHQLQEDLGEDWIVRFSVQGDEAWLTAEKQDGSQHVEGATADVLREAVALLDEGGGGRS